ncbi:MAG: response regulator [Tatlockia sp.]|jgi:DNA-binding NtrC family response regulator
MRILIVEDNAFNAFCLTRLLEVMDRQVRVEVVQDSVSALNFLARNRIELVILDGCLEACDGLQCNGPVLASLIWSTNPNQTIVAWSDSESMRLAFAEVFKQYNKRFNEQTCWSKVVSAERIRQSVPFLVAQQAENNFFIAPTLASERLSFS